MSTLVGTPPNLSFVRIFEILFPDAPPIAFGQWLVMALPIGVIMIGLVWFFLTKVFYRTPAEVTVDHDVIAEEKRALGPISYEERWIGVVFATTASALGISS